MDVYTDGRIETVGIVALLLPMSPEKRSAIIAGLSMPETSVDQARLAAIIERYPSPNLAGVERAKAFCRRYRATGFETAVLDLMTPVDETAWRERRRGREDFEERVTQGRYITHMFAYAASVDDQAATVQHRWSPELTPHAALWVSRAVRIRSTILPPLSMPPRRGSTLVLR